MESINIKGTNIYYDDTSISSEATQIDVIALLKYQLIKEIENERYDNINFYINLLDIVKNNYTQINYPFYKDIVEELFDNKKLFYINNCGLVCNAKDVCNCDLTDSNLSTSIKSLKRLTAINRLNNITDYYNRNTTFNYVQYYIEYDKTHDDFYIEEKHDCTTGMPFFYNKGDAQIVLNNPNFRNILNVIFK